MEIIDINKKEPRQLFNVLVLHTVLHQDFWTRGFLCGGKWVVMTWEGSVNVPKKEIVYWSPLPQRSAK